MRTVSASTALNDREAPQCVAQKMHGSANPPSIRPLELTFIVLHLDRSAAGMNKETIRSLSTEELVRRCKMAGDVNVFLSPLQEDDDDDEDEDEESKAQSATPRSSEASAAALQPQMRGELEIMIAGAYLTLACISATVQGRRTC